MRVLFSLGWNETLSVLPGTYEKHTIDVQRRNSDWGLRRTRKLLRLLTESMKVLRAARPYDALVVCTGGYDAFLIARGQRLVCPKTRLVLVDVIWPRSDRSSRRVFHWLRGAHRIGCIRRGDLATAQKRFGVRAESCFFVPFPVGDLAAEGPANSGDYIYSAGAAHRDWPTLISALDRLEYPAILSPASAVAVPETARNRVKVLPMQSPQDGRRLMSKAKVVALSFTDTELASGPLLLLEAMSMGKAIVATDVNGTRDYVIDGKTGILVPPGDPARLADAINSLMGSPSRRAELGTNARAIALDQFTMQRFVDTVLGALDGS